MADFCKTCSTTIFGEDFRDLAEIADRLETICEGCGWVVVNREGEVIEKLPPPTPVTNREGNECKP